MHAWLEFSFYAYSTLDFTHSTTRVVGAAGTGRAQHFLLMFGASHN